MAEQGNVTSFIKDIIDSFLAVGSTGQSMLLAEREVLFQTTYPSTVFDHLPRANNAPEMVICSWTGSKDLRPSTLKPNEVLNLVSDRYRATLDKHLLSVYDRWDRVGFFWSPGLKDLSPTELSTPYRNVLHWWASDNRMQLTHAAAVGHSDGGVLLVGKGGVGKSTTALACLVGGLDYVSDDYCLVGHKRGEPYAWSVYNSGKLDSPSLHKLPQLIPRVTGCDSATSKNILSIPKAVSGLPLKALVVPKVGATYKLRPISKAEALLALAPSTIFQLPQVSTTMPLLSEVVSQLPCYELEVGRPDVRQVREVIETLL